MTSQPSSLTESVLQIKELNARYNFAVDEGDADCWAACFTRNGTFNALIEGQKPVGTAELKAFVKVVTDAFGEMHHLTTNEVITVEGNTARQKCYLMFYFKINGTLEGHICVYNDWLQYEDGTWKYNRRDVHAKNKFTHLTTLAGNEK